VTRWEYKAIQTQDTGVPLAGAVDSEGRPRSHTERLELGLGELGNEGWELCAMLHTLLVFKRKRACEHVGCSVV